MLSPAIIQAISFLAAIGFIGTLGSFANQEEAKRGNLLGALFMVTAIGVTAAGLFGGDGTGGLGIRGPNLVLLAGVLLVGTAIGLVLARRVAMTSMPELVAILHSFVGMAAVLVGLGGLLELIEDGRTANTAHLVETFVGVLVGGVTLAGSVAAFLKLRGSVSGRPRLLPGRHALNIGLLSASLVLVIVAVTSDTETAFGALCGVAAISVVLGVHLVMAIGGGDMPVAVSLLNSYSGWAASASGFMLDNDLLIVTGALVGSSGAILSIIMCRAMNRSIAAVVFGGFGETPAAAGRKPGQPAGVVTETTVVELADMLRQAKDVIVVPGYGMAVAQAQHAVKEITAHLGGRGIRVRYAIHPVAGRLPGHMNVLLAEANVSYDIVKEMDEINHDFEQCDVVVIIGANDIVNPSAIDDAASPIYGMPVLEVWKARTVVMLKRGMAAGYAGIDNPLCYRENTRMLFGDAKKTVTALQAALIE